MINFSDNNFLFSAKNYVKFDMYFKHIIETCSVQSRFDFYPKNKKKINE